MLFILFFYSGYCESFLHFINVLFPATSYFTYIIVVDRVRQKFLRRHATAHISSLHDNCIQELQSWALSRFSYH